MENKNVVESKTYQQTTDAESQQWQPKRTDKQSSKGWQYLGEGRETTG